MGFNSDYPDCFVIGDFLFGCNCQPGAWGAAKRICWLCVMSRVLCVRIQVYVSLCYVLHIMFHQFANFETPKNLIFYRMIITFADYYGGQWLPVFVGGALCGVLGT